MVQSRFDCLKLHCIMEKGNFQVQLFGLGSGVLIISECLSILQDWCLIFPIQFFMITEQTVLDVDLSCMNVMTFGLT